MPANVAWRVPLRVAEPLILSWPNRLVLGPPMANDRVPVLGWTKFPVSVTSVLGEKLNVPLFVSDGTDRMPEAKLIVPELLRVVPA